MPTSPLRLAGDFVVLEPLSLDHLEGLKDAVNDGELWKLWYANIAKPAEMRQDIERRLDLCEAGSMLPYTVIRKVDEDSGYIAGMTNVINIDRANRVAEIGATFEGVMRRHRVLKNGTTRDTALYSILDHEWPTVRAHLEYRLQRAAQ